MAYNSIKGGEYNMNERIKELRKSLGLTQEKFAERLKMKRNTIANYEIGRNDPIPAVVTLICKEFNVNEDWLRNGTGEMFIEVPEEAEFEAAAAELSKNNDVLALQAVIQYWKLDEASREAVRKYVKNLSSRWYNM